MKLKILVGCSTNFRRSVYFSKKLESILSEIKEYDIYSLNDSYGIIENYFYGNIAKIIKISSTPSEINKTVSKINYAIYFWDGTDLDKYIYYSLLEGIKLKIITVRTTKVANKDKYEPYDLYIGRGTPWGNPFAIGDNGMTREDVIEKYKTYFKDHFLSDPIKLQELSSLKNKILGCHCKPSQCHGDIIADYFNSLEEEVLTS